MSKALDEFLFLWEMTERKLGFSSAPMVGAVVRVVRWPFRVLSTNGRRRAAGTVALVLASGVVSPSQMAVVDAAHIQTSKLLAELKKQEDQLSQLWKEGKDNGRFLTDLLQVYRTIKLAKSQYEAVANFNLMSNINVVDILPIVPLPDGFIYGDSEQPAQTFRYTDENGQEQEGKVERSLALRFTSKQGGAASTFQDWGKFKPNLKIDLSQIANQLSNIDFDAAEMTQFVDGTGHPLASAYRALGPTERLGKITSFYNGMLTELQNWKFTFQQEKAAQAMLDHDSQAMLQDFEQSIALNRQQLRREAERQLQDRQLTYARLNMDPPPGNPTAEFWQQKQQSFERDVTRRRIFLDGITQKKRLQLDQLMLAFNALKASHSGTQTAMEALKTVEAAQASMSSAEQNFQKQRQDLLAKYGMQFKSGVNFEETPSLQMNDQAWKQYQAMKDSRDTAVNKAKADMEGALARISQLKGIEDAGKAFDSLQEDLGKNLLNHYLSADGMNLSGSLSQIRGIQNDMNTTIAKIDEDERRDAVAISKGAIEKLDTVVDKYMNTYVWTEDKNGNSHLSRGGLPVYIVTRALGTYFQAFKRAFGASNVADIMMPDDSDTRKKADQEYRAFLNSMFKIRG